MKKHEHCQEAATCKHELTWCEVHQVGYCVRCGMELQKACELNHYPSIPVFPSVPQVPCSPPWWQNPIWGSYTSRGTSVLEGLWYRGYERGEADGKAKRMVGR